VDVVFIGLVVVLYGATVALVLGLERIRRGGGRR
jgi:hypothetical protein